MGLLNRVRQNVDWHRAELDPRDTRRVAKRAEYDARYGKCEHGTHDNGACATDD